MTLLNELTPGLKRRDVLNRLGKPLAERKFSQAGHKLIEWDYKLYHYAGAIADVSPYFDIYTLTFVDGALRNWEKTGGPTASDFARAQAFVDATNQTATDINKSLAGTSGPAAKSEPSRSFTSPSRKLLIFGGPNHKTYLGCLSCSKYDSDSIFNAYGEHGSKYSSASIFNKYSEYGSRYSTHSPCNPQSQDAPVVVDLDGNYYGRLTLNPHADPIDQPDIMAFLMGLCGNR